MTLHSIFISGILKSMNVRKPSFLLCASFLLCITVLLGLSCANVYAAPAASPSAVPSASPKATPRPAKKCCFCVSPNEGERDSEWFSHKCLACYLKDGSCTSIQQVPDLEAANALAKQNYCSEIALTNLQHGPIASRTEEYVRVCVTKHPECSLISVNDLSCSSYQSEVEAMQMMQRLQQSMGPGTKIELCGYASDALVGCNNDSGDRKTYIIYKNSITVEHDACETTGERCSASPGYIAKCWDGEVLVEQKCCATTQSVNQVVPFGDSKDGYWAPPGGSCAELKCDTSCLPEVNRCENNIAILRTCERVIDGGGHCFQYDLDCSPRLRCGVDPELGFVSCLDAPKPNPTPESSPSSNSTPTPSTSSKATSAAQKTGSVATTSSFSFKEPVFTALSGDYSLWYANRLVVSKALAGNGLVGTTRFVEGAKKMDEQGLSLETVSPSSLLGLLKFKDGDIIIAANKVPVLKVSDLRSVLQQSIADAGQKKVEIKFARKGIRQTVTIYFSLNSPAA